MEFINVNGVCLLEVRAGQTLQVPRAMKKMTIQVALPGRAAPQLRLLRAGVLAEKHIRTYR